MTKLRLLLALLAVVALLLLPVVALAAEPLPPPQWPCHFYGDVTENGQKVPDDTPITATILGEPYSTKTPSPYGPSTYSLEIRPGNVTYGNETVTFRIGDSAANETAKWVPGGNIRLDLTVGEGPVVPPGGGIAYIKIGDRTYYPDATTGGVTIDQAAITGPKGDTGDTGSKGNPGDPGKSAPIIIPIVALILAVIALLVAVVVFMRKPAAKT